MTNEKVSNIEIYNDMNKRISFSLTHTKDEIILTRPDTGLRYHFSTETGERLLKLKHAKPN
jgi:hypothetical protein